VNTKLKRIEGAAFLLLLLTLNYQFSTAFAQGTAFTYQGGLNAANLPVCFEENVGQAASMHSGESLRTLFASSEIWQANIVERDGRCAVLVTNGCYPR
jgi:hypothetical protein